MKTEYIQVNKLGDRIISKKYYRDKEMHILHREDGPAIEYEDKQYYYINGNLHREDGPAVATPEHESWYQNDVLHREDGPAVKCYYDGAESWWLNGIRYTEEEHAQMTKKEVVLSMDDIAKKFGIDVNALKVVK